MNRFKITMAVVFANSVLTTSCSIHTPIESLTIGDEELRPYVEEFLSDAASRAVEISTDNLSVVFVDDLSENDVGQCQRDSSYRLGFGRYEGKKKHVVAIKKSFWDTRDEWGRRQIVYHELGHCILNRSHDGTKFEYSVPQYRNSPQPAFVSVPASLMYPGSFGSATNSSFRQLWPQYVEELFLGVAIHN